jgi:hypothetical protein
MILRANVSLVQGAIEYKEILVERLEETVMVLRDETTHETTMNDVPFATTRRMKRKSI